MGALLVLISRKKRKLARCCPLETHRFIRQENVVGFPSRVDVALLYFIHGINVASKFGRARRARRRDICHDQMFDGASGELGGEGDGHGDFATPERYVST